ncbi:lasso peptide biosynthesis B2 protein [Caulobacter hibisci]|uniref:Lasso peptide biosynthesis B2 protein n=1 Tax=Caulobacter hibisci TaxID=2035993 RepID=A0ABS0SXF8_9CAUL|nr:lasso peptide biosynthesis B2 protein [Caulobacter hibisci]MBI1684219.1 lasso peptide biosynthesis B2 protein [Caulobacter hibisci]
MTYALAEGVTYCIAEGRGVALDLARDRYLGLTAGQTEALAVLTSGPETVNHVSALRSLVAQGLLVEREEPDPPLPCQYLRPSRSLSEEAHGRSGATAQDLIDAALALASTWLLLRTRPLAEIVARRRRRRRRGRGGDAAAVVENLARRFLAVRGLTPLASVCLLDSLALADFLARRGSDADVVFAVGVGPFEAHAWVQAGDCALNETVHRAAMLTPILVT